MDQNLNISIPYKVLFKKVYGFEPDESQAKTYRNFLKKKIFNTVLEENHKKFVCTNPNCKHSHNVS